MSDGFDCDTCYDTELIDQGGREIRCPDCTFDYHPRSVTIEPNPNFVHGSPRPSEARYLIRDRSQGDHLYGMAHDIDQAKFIRNKRQGVIKAALTRRANKARRAAAAEEAAR